MSLFISRNKEMTDEEALEKLPPNDWFRVVGKQLVHWCFEMVDKGKLERRVSLINPFHTDFRRR